MFKVDREMVKMHRLFFKDYDGSITEVPQKKIYVRIKELKHLKKLGMHNGATAYGDKGPEIGINQLCKNTNNYLRG